MLVEELHKTQFVALVSREHQKSSLALNQPFNWHLLTNTSGMSHTDCDTNRCYSGTICRVKDGLMLPFWMQEMGYQQVLGEVIRDVRLQARLTHLECAEAINGGHLRQVEKGLKAIKIDTLVALCGVLGVTPSQLLLVVEARLAGHDVEEHLAASNAQLHSLIDAGRVERIAPEDAFRGIRGRIANETRDETRRLQAAGFTKPEIAHQLGVTVRTVERYWTK
ncbi:Fis family transcriptional regulator [Pseudomonas sp. BN411]|uniref:helix-turn-helix domain-containing protein n=1 Tax=Pseudomonas sp. BN411 TaxID=2567887 RepID=UPI0024590FFC|nr:Fis family transcriptional regulator [Pseudomonas sp. BN411]MDH4561709.1 Fis family transcriptional regulator [Pseudomonas sp. BN411]